MKVMGKWDAEGIVFRDPSLKPYINLSDNLAPTTGGRNTQTKFWKSKTPIVERLMNKMLVTGHLKEGRNHKRISGRDTGKKMTAFKFVKEALEIIEQKTKKNPLQTLIAAVENAAPIEETTAFRQGGIIARKPVGVSPQRRLDISLRLLSHGAGQRCFRSKTSAAEGLAMELLAAEKNDNTIYSIKKKEELERVASSAR